MKYLKTFENLEIIYSAGDYVLLDIDKIIRTNSTECRKFNKIPSDKYVIITEVIDSSVNSIYYATEDAQGNDYGVYQFEIIRRMNIEEIDNFNIIKKSTKYNL